MRSTPGLPRRVPVRFTCAGKPPRASTHLRISSRLVVVSDEPLPRLLPPRDPPPPLLLTAFFEEAFFAGVAFREVAAFFEEEAFLEGAAFLEAEAFLEDEAFFEGVAFFDEEAFLEVEAFFEDEAFFEGVAFLELEAFFEDDAFFAEAFFDPPAAFFVPPAAFFDPAAFFVEAFFVEAFFVEDVRLLRDADAVFLEEDAAFFAPLLRADLRFAPPLAVAVSRLTSLLNRLPSSSESSRASPSRSNHVKN